MLIQNIFYIIFDNHAENIRKDECVSSMSIGCS